MDNLNQPLNDTENKTVNKAIWPLVIVIILLVIAIVVAWQFTGEKAKPVVINEPKPVEVIKPEPEKVVEVSEPEIEETPIAEIIEEEVLPTKEPLPTLDESDAWLKIKLPELTWRKELLALMIDDDMIRRFVVFTDNFSQGTVAYEHSPFVLPSIKFTPQKGDATQADTQKVLQWNEESSKRFSLYIDLLRSMDSDSLVQWYLEVKPLIDEAYSELGYDDDFTNTLQSAITRVLDMELPKSSMELVQPSVMYKFANLTKTFNVYG